MWALAAVFSAAFFAFLAWLQATQELGVFLHDSRVAAVLIGLLACAYAAAALLLVIRRLRLSTLVRLFVAGGTVTAVVILPGRLLQISRARTAYGSATERAAHNALRLLISAQEDFRLRHGRYSARLEGLPSILMTQAPRGTRFAINGADSSGWRGSAGIEAITCSVGIGSFAPVNESLHDNFLDDDVHCASGSLLRSEATAAVALFDTARASASSASWPQERADAARTGTVAGSAAGQRWHTRTGGSMRAAAAAADSLVVAGAHGTGWLGALDIRTGRIVWETRAPNWIHQNPVIGSGLVVVGLGDKDRLMAGDPVGLGLGGVAAYDLRTGALVWLARSAGAVMTAPVLWNWSVISVDGAGFLEGRDLRTGALSWRKRMPGYAVMASPALRNDTVFVALAHRHLCAFAAADGATIWCLEADRKFRIGGDPTPSVIGGAVYWSVSHERTGVENIFGRDAPSYVRDKLLGRSRHRSTQWLIAVDAATGRERWKVEIGGGFDPRGNMAGTALAYAQTIVLTAPLARRIVALDTASGKVIWSVVPDAFTRGAVTIADTLVITSDAGRHVHVLDARDGRELCRGILPDASDRSGPTVAGGQAVFTGLAGSVTAIPLSRLTRCLVD